jgi:hypothetical protein
MKLAGGALCIERNPKCVSPDGAVRCARRPQLSRRSARIDFRETHSFSDAAIAGDDEAARGTSGNGFMRFPMWRTPADWRWRVLTSGNAFNVRASEPFGFYDYACSIREPGVMLMLAKPQPLARLSLPSWTSSLAIRRGRRRDYC